ncbi:LysR family transcriptional regulator [Bosea lathyri]|uniref:DNA-binding transcriptional regulator, LysR family n=1 Tax=Bosea lathyri TaxID=1036778 RepID=A0A1H5ZWQ9_9HYPH|nr:LysR family transcriptional regulator [Bosea lathyri]SEG40127.1 DNA-binding transcriptional regulator, LysR family [Bosea lathyri]
MNLRQIELLRAVVRCETTVRAAQELGLSQPAVSNAIKHLESQVGFPLFERVNNRLFPTAEARAIYQDSDPIFQMHAALEAKVQDLKENRAGHVRLIATPPLGYSVIPRALGSFLAKRPKMRVFFDVRRFEHVIDSVENGVAELGFVMGLNENRALNAEVFFSERMVCVMRPEHPLAQKNTIHPKDLAGVPFIALERGTKMGTLVRQAFVEAGEPFSFAVEVRYCNTACVLAESGVGVAVVDPLSPLFSGHYNLAIRAFEPAVQVSASVVSSRKRPLSRAAEAFLREVRVVVGEVAGKLA